MAGGQRLQVDTAALQAAGTVLQGVAGVFESTGGTSVGSAGIGALGHLRLTAAVSDFSEQARRVAADLEGAVTGLGASTSGAGSAYDATESGIAAGIAQRGG
jgi:hypothetical protein